ncbi:transglycosylase SLT domain-containing protein [uncultured Cedecea sp.]|uniref:transglycosylase SLT domain-containing protein n=1 Tax=uncultured Cedecea sp. TaxID=988762 RepID=UPI0026183AD1|nr:transglycosylase SLT domain-containing protein [uncultured Cedecea sp.]
MRIFVRIFLLSVFSNITYAQDCFDLAGRDYQIDPDLLRAISWNESRFKQAAIGKNTDNSIDVGLMQINSQHFSKLQNFGITKEHLTHDACMNIYTGAYILSQAFHKWGVSWQSVGAYNAGFRLSEKQAARRYLYAKKIETTYKAIKNQKQQSAKN